MAELVTLAQLKTFLTDPPVEDDALLADLLSRVQAKLHRDAGRSDIPFQDAEAGRVELRDGTGSPSLFVDYPIDALTSITLGFDHDAPDETLDVSDRAVLVFQAGKRRIVRTDGGVFGGSGTPLYIQITYDARADLPADAGMAVMRVIAAVYLQRGSEDVSAEQTATYDRTIEQVAANDNVWQSVLRGTGRMVLA